MSSVILIRLSCALGLAGWAALGTPGIDYLAPADGSADAAAIMSSVYFPNCSAARAAGAAPIRFGQPGYREGLDGDNDGIACEPYRGY